MSVWREYDPKKGIKDTTEHVEGNVLTVTKTEDVEGLLDRNLEMRNTGATNAGIKNGWWMYCSIPVTVQYELLKRGLLITRSHDRPAIFDIINKEYPHLKVTAKNHSYKRSRSAKPATTTPLGPSLIVR